MIAITGATGHYGKSTIDFLLNKGISSTNIVALVRDETKATDLIEKGVVVKVGDYNNYTTLVNALQGIEKLLLISSSELANRTQQHENVIKAAQEAGVQHILYTSTFRHNESESSAVYFAKESHFNTEKLIKQSGIPYTIFRNNLYMDMLPIFFGHQVLETGVFLPTGDAKSAFAWRNDMAEATANVLIVDGHQNKEYTFSGAENISISEVVKSLSEVVGKEIAYVNPTETVFVETLENAGTPKEYIGLFAGFSKAIKDGEFESQTTDLERLLGRKPLTIMEYLKLAYSSIN